MSRLTWIRAGVFGLTMGTVLSAHILVLGTLIRILQYGGGVLAVYAEWYLAQEMKVGGIWLGVVFGFVFGSAFGGFLGLVMAMLSRLSPYIPPPRNDTDDGGSGS